ncbi:hypothetical protein HpRN61_06390 [Helicobacter pylori]
MFLKLSNTGKSNKSLKNPKDDWMFYQLMLGLPEALMFKSTPSPKPKSQAFSISGGGGNLIRQ